LTHVPHRLGSIDTDDETRSESEKEWKSCGDAWIADETDVIHRSRCESSICCSYVSVLCLLTYGLRQWSEFDSLTGGPQDKRKVSTDGVANIGDGGGNIFRLTMLHNAGDFSRSRGGALEENSGPVDNFINRTVTGMDRIAD